LSCICYSPRKNISGQLINHGKRYAHHSLPSCMYTWHTSQYILYYLVYILIMVAMGGLQAYILGTYLWSTNPFILAKVDIYKLDANFWGFFPVYRSAHRKRKGIFEIEEQNKDLSVVGSLYTRFRETRSITADTPAAPSRHTPAEAPAADSIRRRQFIPRRTNPSGDPHVDGSMARIYTYCRSIRPCLVQIFFAKSTL